MIAAALGHRIETLNEGATCFLDGEWRPMPLTDTRIDVRISRGLATIKTTRTFRNAEEVSIEAVLTMPVGFDAVVTGLSGATSPTDQSAYPVGVSRRPLRRC